MNKRKLTVLGAIYLAPLLILFLVNPSGFWHSSWPLLWLVVGTLMFPPFQMLLMPDPFLRLYSDVENPNRVMWFGIGAVICAAAWVVIAALSLTLISAVIHISPDGALGIIGLPALFLVLAGMVLINLRIMNWLSD